MITGAAYLHRLAIEEETFVDIEAERANAQWRLITIDNSSALLQLRDNLVQIWMLVRPKDWRRHLQCLTYFRVRVFPGHCFLNATRYFPPLCILNNRCKVDRSSASRTVIHPGLNDDFGCLSVNFGSRYVCAPMFDVDRIERR